MKLFAIALMLVMAACVIGLLLAQVGKSLFTGESFPPPHLENKAVYYVRVPAPSPISP